VANEPILKSKLEEVNEKLAGLPWNERLDLITKKRVTVRRVKDDLKREVAFYEATLAFVSHVTDGLKQLEAHGIPHHRPNDRYAAVVKSGM